MIIWMIYKNKDYLSNTEYVKWYKSEGRSLGLEIKLIILEKLDVTIYDGIHGFLYEGEKISSPDGVINRSRNWEIAYMIENAGIRVFNSSKINMLANDKMLSYSKVSSLGIPIMSTDTLTKVEENYIYKSRKGHGGKEVFRSNNKNIEEVSEFVNDDYLRQSICKTIGKDIRVYVLAGEILICILRSSLEDFRSNYKLGGHIEKYQLNDEQKEIVMKLINSMDFDYVGVDFLLDEHDNLIFNEIEDPVGSRMVSKIAKEINIATEFLSYIKRNIDS